MIQVLMCGGLDEGLVRNGTIPRFHAHVSPEKVGLGLLAFVLVGWSEPATEQQFLRRIAQAPQVQECHQVTGAWNYLIPVRLSRTTDPETFNAEVIKDVPGLQRTETTIVLSSGKETTMIEPAPSA
ncbi:MAG TPA: Lrp/AsnC family transcriptional regulator [Alphaproteobacteria bacterium]|nr:Lrp/AsnC family transcriptional regulator [Alphaproteobacteria bacterium]